MMSARRCRARSKALRAARCRRDIIATLIHAAMPMPLPARYAVADDCHDTATCRILREATRDADAAAADILPRRYFSLFRQLLRHAACCCCIPCCYAMPLAIAITLLLLRHACCRLRRYFDAGRRAQRKSSRVPRSASASAQAY